MGCDQIKKRIEESAHGSLETQDKTGSIAVINLPLLHPKRAFVINKFLCRSGGMRYGVRSSTEALPNHASLFPLTFLAALTIRPTVVKCIPKYFPIC